jgi:hypothetical protein
MKERASLDRTAKNFRLFAGVAGLFGTPAIMFVGFSLFGTAAAVQFRIFDVTADYSSGVIVALLLLALIQVWPIPAAHRAVLTLLWLVRVGVTLGVMLAFEAYYGLDAGKYYRIGQSLNDPLAMMSFGGGTGNMIAIVSLLTSVTESYSAMKVIFSYVGLIAVYIFYRTAVMCLGKEHIAVLYAIGLLPSLLFWTSILGKDPIVLLGIAIYCYGAAGMMVRQKMSMLVFVVIGLMIASFIRIWLGVIFATPLITTYVLASRAPAVTKLLFMLITAPGFFITLQGFALEFSLETTQDLVTRTQSISTSWARGGSALQIEGSFTSIGSMIAFMPLGSFTALFRPLPFEVLNPFGMLAGAENAYILSLIVIGLIRNGFGWIRQPVLLWAVSVVVVWATVYGFASYQNLGSAFRFRAQVAPILLLLGLYLTYVQVSAPGKPLLMRPVSPRQDETAFNEGITTPKPGRGA